ncbi:MAG: CBS domain-containing protein [Candidatus Thorarchaeota archaeon]
MKIKNMMIEDVVTASGDMTIREAIDTLHHKHIGSIIVINEDRKCEGIFTERDAIRVVATDIPLSAPLREVMTTHPKTISEEATFAMAKDVMRSNRIRHLPVTDSDGHLIGLLSFRAVLDEVHNMHT